MVENEEIKVHILWSQCSKMLKKICASYMMLMHFFYTVLKTHGKTNTSGNNLLKVIA